MARVTFSNEDILRSKIIPPGWYKLLVKSMSEEQAGTDGSDLFVYKNIIQGGNYEGVPLRFQISEKAMGFGIPYLVAGGVDVKPGVAVDLNDNVGKVIEGFVQRGEYKGKPTNELVDFRVPKD